MSLARHCVSCDKRLSVTAGKSPKRYYAFCSTCQPYAANLKRAERFRGQAKRMRECAEALDRAAAELEATARPRTSCGTGRREAAA